MFPEFHDLIIKLKVEDPHFYHLFEKENELDHRIKAIENNIEFATDVELENLKKERLHLKDEMYEILKKHSV
ncbi:MAG: YdcH family protein [Pasteurellaceae bacterium]|nr:YdcH family protein [Pasteurellaceae bacterium]